MFHIFMKSFFNKQLVTKLRQYRTFNPIMIYQYLQYLRKDFFLQIINTCYC
jgi:hypothetical protein